MPQTKKPVVKKTTKTPNKYKSLGGEIGNPPFTPAERKKMPKVGSTGSAKNGTSLGMKSVKAGFDKNPGVTRADIITAATKKAKTGTSVPKKNSVSKNIGNLNKAKSGTSMKKCKYVCK
jgi:hypothetical protein